MQEPTFKIREENKREDYAEFVIEPLETGFGETLGNTLRRVLLTSIPGAAVTSVKIAGVKHRFSTITGVKENVVEVLLNLKKLNFRLLDGKTTATVKLSVKGIAEVTAADLDLPEGIEIVNKDSYIAYVADKKAKLDMEITVEQGYGFSLAEERKVTTLGVIPTDAIFTPIRRVSSSVEATRVGRQTNLDKLVLRVWTNGTVDPRSALDEAAKILASYFTQIYQPQAATTSERVTVTSSIPDEVLRLTVDELDLPTRIHNSLRNGGIETVGQLLETPRKELMSMRNMGGKSLSVIEEKLQEKGIALTI